MDYMRQFNAFCVKSAGMLSSNAVNLYVRLFALNNQHGWTEYFPASHSLLCMTMGIGSYNTLKSVRDELKRGGYIQYKDGGHRKPTLYKLIPLYMSNSDTKTDSKPDTKTDSKPDTIIDIDLNKKEKKSASHSKKKQAFSPPTLQDVQAYIQEKGLAVDAVRFFEYYDAGGWHDGNNKPVKNWKQKCITWDRHDTNRHSVKVPQKQTSNDGIDWSKYDG